MEIVCFHNPYEENACFSNWYRSEFKLDGITFSSLEQYMMYVKAVCFHDDEIAKLILATDDPATIKALGRKVANFDNSYWNGIRQIVVYRGLIAKFAQDADLRQKLIETKQAVLAECSLDDKIWGNGIAMNDPKRFDLAKWKGQNLMGYILMMVRAALK